jgi:hypothetical protein
MGSPVISAGLQRRTALLFKEQPKIGYVYFTFTLGINR